MNKGFTLVELLVTVTIFIVMTALLVARYGSFNDGAILSSTSYDIALALRDAQSYGVNVQGKTVSGSQNFNYPYGIHFDSSAAGQHQFVLFADSSLANGNIGSDGIYTSGKDAALTTYTPNYNAIVSGVCATNGSMCTPASNATLDITFKRPDPNAIIVSGSTCTYASPCAYAEIQIKSGVGTGSRTIVVRQTGEIAVQNQ